MNCRLFSILIGLSIMFPRVHAGTTYYVIPGGGGNGTGWADGIALDTALAAAVNGDVFKLKQGVHAVSTAVTLTDVSVTIKGGYTGASEAEEPTGDKYSTIISNDSGLNNVWAKFDPETGVEALVTENDGAVPVIKNGAINPPPAYKSNYQVYYPVHESAGTISKCYGTLQTFISLDGTASVNLENLTVSGFGWSTGANGSFMHFTSNPATAVYTTNVFKNVAFVGNAGATSIVNEPNQNNYVAAAVTGCETKFCRIDGGSAFNIAHWGPGFNFTNCVFESIYSGGFARTTAIAIHHPGRATFNVNGCAFRRLVHYNVTASSTSTAVGGFAISSGVTGGVEVDDCEFDCNWLENTCSLALVNTSKYLYFKGCRFRGNVTKVKTSHASAMNVPGCIYFSGDAACIIDACLFASNSIAFTSSLAAEAYAAPVFDLKQQGLLMDSVFDNNGVTMNVTAEGARVNYSRSLLILLGAAAGSPRVDTLNCTFTGETPGDDIVLSSTKSYTTVATTLKIGHWHDIFWSGAHDYFYSGAVSDISGAAGHMTVERSVVKNGGANSPNVVFTDCNADDPMLAVDSASGVWKPSVAVKGAKGLPKPWYIVGKNPSTGAFYFHRGREAGTTNMFYLTSKTVTSCLLSRNGTYSITDTKYTLAKPDYFGNARADGNSTAGPAETVLPAGHILAALVSPCDAGYVSIGSQYASAGAYQAVTAVCTDPSYIFSKWVDEDGETISTAATYTFPDDTDYKRVTALFSAPTTTWTFKVAEGKGVFTNGTTQIVMEVEPGATPPDYPQVSVSSGWHKTGWDPAMPPVVGSAPLEFNVTFIPYTKVVYYDSHASGANDGTSWTDAYTSLKTAVNDAAGASYVGEVRARQGLHLINSANYAQFKNVRIIGGYTGSGDARSTERRLTVFTGDTNGADAFVDHNGSTVGKVYDNGSFITFRAPTAEEVYWALANYSDDFYYFLGNDDTVTCTNSRLECLTLTGFYHAQYKAVTSGKYNSVTITNCDFVGCHNTYSLAQGDVELGAEADVLDCGFYGHTGAVLYFNGQANSDIFRVKGCKFLYFGHNSGAGRMTTVLNSAKGSVIAEDCEFGHIFCENYLESGTANSNYSGPLLVAFNFYNPPTVPPVLRNCRIHDIRSPRNDKTASLVNMASGPGGTVENCVFEDCFLGEEYSNAKTYKNTATTFLEASTVTNCTFKNCSLAYTGDAANIIANFMTVTNGVWDTTFENCRLESAMNYPSTFVLTRNNGPVAGSCVFKNCSVTNTGTYANAAYGVAMLIGGRAINYNSSPLKALGPVAITGCEVYAPNMNNAVLVDDIGSVSTVKGASIVGNKVKGGTAVAAVVRAAGGTFVNATVANNIVSDSGAGAAAATVYRPSTALSVGWSTFAGNSAPYEFYVVGNYKLTLTSSVVWSGASGWSAYGSSTAASAANGVAFANSCMKGIDSGSAYFSGENAYTATPVFAAKITKWADGRLFVPHTTGSPYAKGNAALAGVYAAEVALDACGAERPVDNVVIGAVQQVVPVGLLIKIR